MDEVKISNNGVTLQAIHLLAIVPSSSYHVRRTRETRKANPIRNIPRDNRSFHKNCSWKCSEGKGNYKPKLIYRRQQKHHLNYNFNCRQLRNHFKPRHQGHQSSNNKRTHSFNCKRFTNEKKTSSKSKAKNHFCSDSLLTNLDLLFKDHIQETTDDSDFHQDSSGESSIKSGYFSTDQDQKVIVTEGRVEKWTAEEKEIPCCILHRKDCSITSINRDCSAIVAMDVGNPSLSSFPVKEGSPVLASLANLTKSQERGNPPDPEQHKVLMASLTKVIKRRSPCKQDEFWEALQVHYNYLMDEELIKSCKEANGELCQDGDENSSPIWAFSEYTEQYKELSEWLEKMRSEIYIGGSSSQAEETVKEAQAEEFRSRKPHRMLFNDQSHHLMRRYPNLKDEITLQVAHINSCWDALEQTIATPEVDTERLLKDIAREMRCLRKWLRETENRLKPPTIFPGCTVEDLERKYKELQALQEEIESRQKSVFSVLKLCGQLESDPRASALARDAGHVKKVALNLQRRWHSAWLKSLEYHFVLEDLIKTYRTEALPGNGFESSLNDEPLTKYPRLSGEWSGNPLITRRDQSRQKDDQTDFPFVAEHCDYHVEESRCEDAAAEDDELLMSEEMDDEFYSALEDSLTAKLLDESIKTRDIGTGHAGMLSTNDKGVMVGSTGITELKAGHEGSFEPFEIVQDVGYSSESSTQLSNDERSGDSFQIYSYQQQNTSVDGKPEMGHVRGVGMTNTTDECVQANGHCDGSLDEEMEDSEETVNRLGPNRATFYFRHVDTDPECRMDDSCGHDERQQQQSQTYMLHSTPCKYANRNRSVGRGRSPSLVSDCSAGSEPCLDLLPDSAASTIDWSLSEDDFGSGNQLTDAEKLQKMGFESTVAWEKGEVGSFNGIPGMATQVETNGNCSNQLKTLHCQDAIHALVEQAERLVREDTLSDLIGKRQYLEPLKLGEAQVKANRLKEWLRKQHPTQMASTAPALPPVTVLDSSCDASGECTSNDTEDEHSDSSEEQNNSVIMRNGMTGSLIEDGLLENGENASTVAESGLLSSPGKVVMRNKKRGNGDRPWSVTELYQLTNRLDLSPFSISESALNNLLTPTGPQDFSGNLQNSSPSIISPKELTLPSSEGMNSTVIRKTKSAKTRRRFFRKSDSGSDNHSQLHSGGSDGGGTQKSPMRRRLSRGSKSHSSSSGGSKCAGMSSGTEQGSNDANGGNQDPVDLTDSECEPIKIGKVGKKQSEELSSLSEQAWDDYQDAPYLSEAYSEKPIDEEMIRKLMNFGDDYSAFIESQSDSISVGSYRRMRQGLSGRGRSGRNQVLHRSEPMEEDSDSDLDDLRHVIEESSSQLLLLENRVRKHLIKEKGINLLSIASDYIELFATCQTNINCLQVIAGHIQARPHCTSVTESDIKEIKDTIHRWEHLRNQMQDHQSDDKLNDVRQQISELQECMNNLDNFLSGCKKNINNKDILERMIQEFQAYLSTLQEKKASLLTINVQVHSFLSNTGDVDVTLAKLKEDVADLYQRWDSVFEKGHTQLTALHTLKTTWLQFESDLEELQSDLRQDQKQVQSIESSAHLLTTCVQSDNNLAQVSPIAFTLTVPGEPAVNGSAPPTGLTSNPELATRCQLQLAELRSLASQLEAMLAETEAWESISQNLNSTAADVQRLQQTRGRRKSSFLVPNQRSDVPKRVRFSIAPDMDKNDSPTTAKAKNNKNRSLLWRVMRAAIPIQLAIIVLLCMGYLLGPDCCDTRNNFIYSFSPHLRYINGPPPI